MSIISKLKFKGHWRTYQQRVLDELDYHLDDSKLNVVAAPGAGKTTLGIEAILRLDNPVFILAPTITIKNQWKQRILDNFSPPDFNSDLISTDIKNISEITVSTYQGLHSLFKNKEERENFIKKLKDLNINTLVLDEAHHLRTEWWATLNSLYKELNNKNFKIVSLTGTPPYDVSPAEWNNYTSLCGQVDVEISIPELVKAGDLCPHQDLIYFSNLTDEEQKIIFDFEAKRDAFFKDINEHSYIVYAVESSPFINNIDSNPEIIYKDLSFTISLISYLLKEDELSINARILIEFLDLTIEQIPKFDYGQAEILFNGIIGEFDKEFKNIPLIKNKLREYKLINGKTVDFTGKIDFKKLFARSKNKLEAIYSITDFEYKNLNSKLREVVLLDYIGKGDSEGVNILSVFDKLQDINCKYCILTGSLIVIPKTAKEEMYKILQDKNIDTTKVLTTEYSENYLRVETYGNFDIVAIITKLFEKGCFNVLIGTSALLGEGWDSPCVNTLVIASVVGSFMLSNQMRGRALRTDKNNPNKTSNIWHLVSLTKNEQSPDLEVVERRFNTFEGISYKDNRIQSGTGRLNINYNNINSLNCKTLNEKMMEYAGDRYNLPDKWKQIFQKTEKNVESKVYQVAEINTSIESKVKNNDLYLDFKDNLDVLINKPYNIYKLKLSQKLQTGIANCIAKTLCDIGKIKTKFEEIKIKSYKDKTDNKVYLTFLNCNDSERNILIKSFCDIFYINDDTRYILKFNDEGKIKYLPVPELIGQKGEYVRLFLKNIKNINKIKIENFDKNAKIVKIKKDADKNIENGLKCVLIPAVCALFYILLLAFLTKHDIFLDTCEKLTPYIVTLSLSTIAGFILVACGIIKHKVIELIREFISSVLPEYTSIDIIFIKSAKNKQELLRAKYNIYLSGNIKQSKIWI